MKMNFNFHTFLFVVLIISGIIGLITTASAVSVELYPIAELGNCASETECKSFCDRLQNSDACISFAEKYNMTSGDEEKIKKFKELKEKPGDCKTTGECESYCNDISHIDECIAFAEKNNFMPSQDLEDAKKIQAALARGANLPGNCKSKESCENYCNDPNHMEECIEFGEAFGLIPADELDEAKKVLQAVKKGAKPPPCKGKTDCDSYCSQPNNFESCISFAEAAGLIPAGELEDAKKMLQAIKKGANPPACRGKEECDAYCTEPSHIEECVTFAEAAGFMSKEDAEMVRKTGGVGPGGCRSNEACDSFCQNPDNQETCFNFGLEHGLIPQADIQRMEEGKRKMQESVNNAPPEVLACLVNALGQERVDKIKSGNVMPRQSDGEKMRVCFESYESQRQEQEQRQIQERESMREGERPSGSEEEQPTNRPLPTESSGQGGETIQPNQEEVSGTSGSSSETTQQTSSESSSQPAQEPVPQTSTEEAP